MTNNYRTVMNDGRGDFDTLLDILPDDSSPRGRKLTMLIIAKRPAPESVSIGHYFQGIEANNKGKRTGHGPMFWRQLRDYGIMRDQKGRFEDECLLENGYGIMDIVKMPASTGVEPTKEEYRIGMERIMQTIKTHEPDIILFVYKPPLQELLRAMFNDKTNPNYGFNAGLERYFGARVFLCPLPGVGGANRETIHKTMTELGDAVKPRGALSVGKVQ